MRIKTFFLILILHITAITPMLSQNTNRNSEIGIHLTGEMTTKMKGCCADFMGDTLYLFVPNSGFKGIQIGGFYKLFINHTNAFLEAQIGAYYMGQKRSSFFFFGSIDSSSKEYLDNYDMDEWGGIGSLVAGYSFPINTMSSLDVFSGPEVRSAFSCMNSEDKNLLNWHYNRWLMRWKFGIGFNHRHVAVDIYGSCDVTKKSKQVNTRNFTLSLGLGYKF